jgi:hypothetical protein
LHQVERRRLAFTPDDDIDLGMAGEHLLAVVRRVNAAVDGNDAGQGRLDGAERSDAAGVRLRRADVGDHDDVGAERGHAADDLPVGQVVTGGINQRDGVAGVEQRPADHEQTQWHLVANPVIADSRAQGGVDEGNAEHR